MLNGRLIWRLSPQSLVRSKATVAPQLTIADNVLPYSEVPGPKPLPLLGNAWRFMPVIGTFQPSDFLKWTNDLHATYGEIVKISNLPGRSDMLFLFNPSHIEKVFRNEGAWPERFVLGSMQHFRNNVRPDFFEGYQGILSENGKNWQTARTVVNPVLMQPKVTRQYVGKIDQVAKDFIKRIPSLRDDNQEMPAHFNNELHKWALESISLIALDTRLGCLEKDITSDPQKMIDAVREIFDGNFELDMKLPFWKLCPTPQLKKFIKHSEIFLKVCLKYVERAQASMSEDTPEGDMSVLQRPEHQESGHHGHGFDHGGHRHVAAVLYHLARSPKRQERLFQELNLHMPASPDTSLTADILENMKYLRACIKESMRLFPVTHGTIRRLNKEIVLDNYLIKENVKIVICTSTLQHMDKHFSSADKFIPERWLRGKLETGGCPQATPEQKAHPFVYLPFGHGPRQCVGMRFANLEMETLVARMVHKFRLEWHHGDLEYVSKLLNMPTSPLKYRVIDRD